MNKKTIKEITYTNPYGTEFIFVEDIEKNMSPTQFKRWDKVSMGSTGLLTPHGGMGIYPYDLRKFLRLDKLNK